MKKQMRLIGFLLLSMGLALSACKSKPKEEAHGDHDGHAHGSKEGAQEKDEHGHDHEAHEKEQSKGGHEGHGDEEKGHEEAGHGGHAGQEGEHGDEVHLTDDQIKMMKIKVMKVEQRSLTVVVEALGDIASDTDRVVQVRSEFPGTIKEVLVAVGDAVAAGQILVRYESEGADAGIKELKAVKQGVVVGLYGEVEGHVDPAVPLATLADTSRLRAGLDIYEKDLGRVRKGQLVDIVVSAYPKEVFQGRITYISPRVDENSRTVKVRVDVENPKGLLKFGMFITGRVRVAERRVLAIPEGAIQEVEGKTSVFVKNDDGGFSPHPVHLGERSQGWVELLSGVENGESIVSHGSFVLKAELAKGEASHEH